MVQLKYFLPYVLLFAIINVRQGEFFSAKFVPSNNHKIQKSENALSVNNDVIQEIESDLFNNGKAKKKNSLIGSSESREDSIAPPQLLPSSNDIASSITSNKALYEKMLYSQLKALKSPKYQLSMETYFFSWINFKKLHSKKYDTFEEEKIRFQTYVDNHEFVRLHNMANDLGLKTFTVALNKFADMTLEEFVNKTCGYNATLRNSNNSSSIKMPKFMAPLNFKAPEEVDWRKEGYVTSVKDQGHCGSCWAFSATGALEGQHRRKLGTLVSLSEQNLVDCSFQFGNEGCNGGLMDNAFQYIKQNHGVDTEKGYPYEAKEGKCRFKKSAIGADDTGFFDVESGNETSLVLALASQGPVSVAIDAGHRSFQFYSKGIYYEQDCSPTQLDHGVLAVGYGTNGEDKDYWIIKNSWGATWGEEGYIKMARNRDNQCGVATQASYPIV